VASALAPSLAPSPRAILSRCVLACREAYPKSINYVLWIIIEIAIAATDLAEVIGSSIALNLLFGIPLWAGVLITSLDVIFILLVGLHNFRLFELLIFILVATIAGCFAYELAVASPDWAKVATGLYPHASIITNADQLYIGLGILGATVMPHNLFLHSSIIQTRNFPRTTQGKRMAVLYGTLDSTISLCLAFFVNASILILAAAAFYYTVNPYPDVDIHTAYELLAPALGSNAARILFGVALLCSGQNATITGTLAGQIVMEGFINIRVRPWIRRLVTRLIAIIPAAIVAGIGGQKTSGKLLVLSQVVLSFALSFAVIPLVHFTNSREVMGKFVNGLIVKVLATILALVIAGLNSYLLVQVFRTDQISNA
jgi:manganese transport protein